MKEGERNPAIPLRGMDKLQGGKRKPKEASHIPYGGFRKVSQEGKEKGIIEKRKKKEEEGQERDSIMNLATFGGKRGGGSQRGEGGGGKRALVVIMSSGVVPLRRGIEREERKYREGKAEALITNGVFWLPVFGSVLTPRRKGGEKYGKRKEGKTGNVALSLLLIFFIAADEEGKGGGGISSSPAPRTITRKGGLEGGRGGAAAGNRLRFSFFFSDFPAAEGGGLRRKGS